MAKPIVGREAAAGSGLSGPPCPERQYLDQRPPAGMPPRVRMCSRCGRITARTQPDGRAWCGGQLPTANEEGR